MATIPSIALIPSGYKAGKVYSVLPTDGTGDLTFTRAGALPSFNATRVNKDGLIEEVLSNVPRLNYPLIDGVVQDCPSLLLEPQRTNLTRYSNDFTLWTNISSVTNNANSVISPDGTQNASNIEFGATGTSKLFYERVSVLLGQVTSSIYLKGAGTIRIYMERQGGGYFAEKTITLTQSWVRYDISVNATSDSVVLFVIERTSSNTATEVDIYGAQLEQGSYATSYIPTQGSTVTRVAETCSKTGISSLINSSEGVLYAEISALANDAVEKRMGLQDAGTFDAVRITYTPTSNSITGVVFNNGASQCNLVHIVTDRTILTKIALKYKENDFSLWVNGIEVATDNSGTTFTNNALDELAFDVNGSANWHGNCKDLRVYNTALTDQELQQLTSL